MNYLKQIHQHSRSWVENGTLKKNGWRSLEDNDSFECNQIILQKKIKKFGMYLFI